MHSLKATQAVITGDLVLSEKLPSAVRRAVPRFLDECVRVLREERSARTSDIDLYRGDAWQMIVEEPSDVAFAMVLIRTELMVRHDGLDSRAVAGIGKIDNTGGERVSTGYGQAFTLSGRGLDALPKDRRMALRAADIKEPLLHLLDTSVFLLDRLMSGWTQGQAQAVSGALRGWSQDEIGGRWQEGPISQQAVAQHLRRASWHAVQEWLDAFATYVDGHYSAA